jgi:hypothetical protein
MKILTRKAKPWEKILKIGKIGSDQILLQFCREIDKAIL